MKKWLCLIISAVLAIPFLSACSKTGDINPDLNIDEDITLHIVGSWETNPAIEAVAAEFSEKYPNCTVEYEYMQNYSDNLVTRLSQTNSGVDLFFTDNIQSDSENLEFAYNLHSEGIKLDLSATFPGLVENAVLYNSDNQELYAIPVGGELRGLYVNKTLLTSLGLDIPKNSDELLAACEVISKAGYIPFAGNPGVFSQRLLYPYICSLIANADDYQKTYDMVNSCDEEAYKLFDEPCQLMYDIVKNDYYKYKYVETELNMCKDLSDVGFSRDFLNIVADENGNYAKDDDIGIFAFMPSTDSLGATIAKVKSDYHSQIEYEFIMSPVGKTGGYAYISPSKAIAVNNKSANTDWAVEFLDFLFEAENNKTYADIFGCIPNTTDAVSVISQKYSIPEDQICEVGQVTFDYNFFSLINNVTTAISKANAPKYMVDDGNGNLSMNELSYFTDQLKEAFNTEREALKQ